MAGDPMGNFDDTSKNFEVDHIYYQWLNFRLKKFNRFSRVMMKILWWGMAIDAIALVLGLVQDRFDNYAFFYDWIYHLDRPWETTVWVILGVTELFPLGVSLGILPVIDLIFILPTIIRSDIHRGFYSMLAAVPVKSADIAADTRGWVIRNTLVHTSPGLLWLISFWLFVIYQSRSGPIDVMRGIVEVGLPWGIPIIAAWYLLMNIIVLSSFRTRIVNTGCLIILLMVLHLIILGFSLDALFDWRDSLRRPGHIYWFLDWGANLRYYYDLDPMVISTVISLTLLLPSLLYRWLQKYFVEWLRQDRVV